MSEPVAASVASSATTTAAAVVDSDADVVEERVRNLWMLLLKVSTGIACSVTEVVAGAASEVVLCPTLGLDAIARAEANAAKESGPIGLGANASSNRSISTVSSISWTTAGEGEGEGDDEDEETEETCRKES